MLKASRYRTFVLLYVVLIGAPALLQAQTPSGRSPVSIILSSHDGASWTSGKVEHIYGLPDVKPHKKGTLTLNADDLTFTGKGVSTTILRNTITAVNSGDERVELWGITGRLLRMTIPDGGGHAVAAVAQHRVDMLTVEFTDSHGGTHSAVFFLAANTAKAALERFALSPRDSRGLVASRCGNGRTDMGSMLIMAPDWSSTEIPAAYQGLLYEHLTDRFRAAKNISRVYRQGEDMKKDECPQYTVHLQVVSFKEGNSVERAMLGPIGMVVGTTQLVFNAALTDTTGTLAISEEIRTTVRDEGESTDIADHVARSFEKKYEKAVKSAAKMARNTPNVQSER